MDFTYEFDNWWQVTLGMSGVIFYYMYKSENSLFPPAYVEAEIIYFLSLSKDTYWVRYSDTSLLRPNHYANATLQASNCHWSSTSITFT